MSSTAEQFAANFSWAAFSKAEELHKRLWFTLMALLIFRFGTYIPLPGIDVQNLQSILQQKGGGMLDILNLFSGGSLQRGAIFSLGIAPYISASITVQLLSYMHPALEALRKKDGEAGRKKLNQYTRYFTIFLAAVQGYVLSAGLEKMQTHAGSVVLHPGFFFRITSMITIVGATILLMWLGEQITARGIGAGQSLIVCIGIVAGIPRAIGSFLSQGAAGAVSPLMIIAVLAMVVGIVAFVVFMETSNRRVTVQYPKGNRAGGGGGGTISHMPLKLNTSGVMGPIFASSLIAMPMAIIGFSGADKNSDLATTLATYFHTGNPVYMIVYGILITFFAFFWTSLSFNTDEIAENLRKQGGFMPGIRPGKATADFLDYILVRITAVGAAYLVFVCLLPQVLVSKLNLPFYFGGTSLLIVVSVTIQTVAQIQSYLFAHHYENTSLFRKARKRELKK